jgi:hypothetical protein
LDQPTGFKIMQVRIYSLFTVILFSMGMVVGQQGKPSITFAEKEYSFGTVRETDGFIIHDFTFTNEGKVPLIINDVKSTCGCTVPEWPHEPVLPGKSGKIRVSFNPGKQSGAISKSIIIQSNADVPQTAVLIKGVVIPTDHVEEVYKFTVGELRLQTIYAAFGEIYKGKTAKYSIRVFNNSSSQPAVVTFPAVPPHLKIRVDPVQIEPQQEGIIEIEYLSSETNSWDYTVDHLKMLVNGKEVSNSRMNVTANIKEDFSGLTAEQLQMAPRSDFDSHQFDFGNIGGDQIVRHSFIIYNRGKSDLTIRKVSASCGCTAVQPAKTTILPGDSTEIKAIFNAHGREGNQKKAITIITNDPRQSRSILWINAVVQKESGSTQTNPE